MVAILWAWGISLGVILVLAGVIGFVITKRVTGVLIDGRGRYSLTHLQIAAWSALVLSLIAGVSIGRAVHHVAALDFDIPVAVLAVMGISLGSGLISSATKSMKDVRAPDRIAAAMPDEKSAQVVAQMTDVPADELRPHFAQVFMQEEGTLADRVVDISKFQNFIITVVLIVGYAAAVVQALQKAGTADGFTGLPDFAGTFLTLLAASHAAYLAGKLPTQAGTPDLTVKLRNEVLDKTKSAQALNAVGDAQAFGSSQIWSDTNRISNVPVGVALGILGAKPFQLNWRFSAAESWRATDATPVSDTSFVAFVNQSTLAGRTAVEFRRRYPADNRWDDQTYTVTIGSTAT